MQGRRLKARTIVGAGLAALLLAGCQKVPKGQVIAIVDGEEISTQQLEAELRAMPIPDGMDPTQLRKAVLQGLIDRHFRVEAAREQGLDKTAEFAALKKKGEEELLATLLGEKASQTILQPTDSDIRDYIDANPLQFARRQRLFMDQIAFTPPKDRSRLSALDGAASLDAVTATLQAMGIASERARAVIDTGQLPADLARELDKTPDGKPVPMPQSGRMIFGAISAREPLPVAPDDARLAAARAVRAATMLHESDAQIAAARATAQISYEPGYEPLKPAR
ncbi:hypothetical protein ASE00_13385 [Sphingomonas sp. Root710]|uniref:peptidyl-prolyl cis-trans isomerase n=1 Tax=Sphingomonas sp. Root710 TaxID=1736594 RepID=UPI0006F9C789|nr:peptidyl-prolyl cis-trans isomerase [Sphingomonas sp. Root710]KRB82978.1 hypothetical protein ASE00_13385 [Sphingomonas sp. Root710]